MFVRCCQRRLYVPSCSMHLRVVVCTRLRSNHTDHMDSPFKPKRMSRSFPQNKNGLFIFHKNNTKNRSTMLRFRGRENDDDRTESVHGGHKVRNGDDIDTGDDDASVRGALVQKLKHASFLVFVTLMTKTINSVDLSTYIQWLAMMPRKETITIDSNDLTFYLYTCLLVSFRNISELG